MQWIQEHFNTGAIQYFKLWFHFSVSHCVMLFHYFLLCFFNSSPLLSVCCSSKILERQNFSNKKKWKSFHYLMFENFLSCHSYQQHQNRKGIHRSLVSVTKKWFGGRQDRIPVTPVAPDIPKYVYLPSKHDSGTYFSTPCSI